MKMVTRVMVALQTVLGTDADRLAEETGAVQRKRKFTGSTLAQTFAVGFLHKPKASFEDLAQMSASCGVPVTPQAIEQRFTPALARFLKSLFWIAVEQVVQANEAVIPLLQRFNGVYLLDSTTITLPDQLAADFPGCGGSYNSGQAAIKFQVVWDLLRGGLRSIVGEAGRDCDVKSSVQKLALPRGSLRIADLGYFCLETLKRLANEGVFWLSRIQTRTAIFREAGEPLDLLPWLAAHWNGTAVEMRILLGAHEKWPCRLLAWKLPEEIANRRRQKITAEFRRKGRTPSSARLAWCDWTILVTNVPPDKLSWKEAVVLYRSRWQIELLFKLWKSQGLVDELTGRTVEQQMVRFWSRMLGVLLQHWILLTTVWGEMKYSFTKVARAIREYAPLIANALRNPWMIPQVLEQLQNILASTARQNKRTNPGTWQLLMSPDLLDYALT